MNFSDLQQEMISAMKVGEKDRKNAISTLIGNIKKVAIDNGCRDNITEEMVNTGILKELKTIKEQIDTCPADRTDLLNKYNFDYNVISEFAPRMLSKEEIIEIINSKFSNVIETKNKGLIMKTIMPEFKGKADGKLINEVIMEMIK